MSYNCNKIAVASAINPAAGLMEYNKQRERNQKRNFIEHQLKCLRPGQYKWLNNNIKVVRNPRNFSLFIRGKNQMDFMNAMCVVDYLFSHGFEL